MTQQQPLLPPRDEAAEQAVLGAMLLESVAVIPRVCAIISATDFYHDAHRQLFLALLTMHDAGEAIDLVTVNAHLRQRGLLDVVGDQARLAALLGAAPTAASAESYAHIVRDKSLLREIITTSQKILAEAYDERRPPAALLTDMAVTVEALLSDAAPESPVISAADLRAQAAPTQWVVENLLPAGAVTLFAGDGGVGKTWVSVHIGSCVAAGTPVFGHFDVLPGPVLYWDEENGPKIMADRLAMSLDGDCPADFRFVTGQGWKMTDPSTFPRLERLIKETRTTLLVADSLCALHDLNENSSGDMGPLIYRLGRLARKTGAAIWLLHHTGKPSIIAQTPGDRSRGSSAIRDGVDVYLHAKRTSPTDFSVEMDKSRFSALQPKFAVRFEEPGPDMVTLRFLGVVDEEAAQESKAEDEILTILETADGWTERPALLEKLKALGVGARAATTALRHLVADKKAVQGPYRDRKRLYAKSFMDVEE